MVLLFFLLSRSLSCRSQSYWDNDRWKSSTLPFCPSISTLIHCSLNEICILLCLSFYLIPTYFFPICFFLLFHMRWLSFYVTVRTNSDCCTNSVTSVWPFPRYGSRSVITIWPDFPIDVDGTSSDITMLAPQYTIKSWIQPVWLSHNTKDLIPNLLLFDGIYCLTLWLPCWSYMTGNGLSRDATVVIGDRSLSIFLQL